MNTTLTQRPMVMNPASVHAITYRLKTETRRVIDPQPRVPSHIGSEIQCHDLDGGPGRFGFFSEEEDFICRYGPPGRILWLKEKWRVFKAPSVEDLAAGCKPKLSIGYGDDPYRSEWRRCDQKTMVRHAHDGHWQNPRYMPAWACRMSVEVLEVKAQRLGAMTVQEIYAEGIRSSYGEQMQAFGEHIGKELLAGRESHLWDNKPTIDNWIWYWNLINGKTHPYDPDLWVWAIKFRALAWKELRP